VIRALVTGGSGTLGAAICQRLADSGFHVIVHANHQTVKAEATTKTIQAGGGSAEIVSFDLTDANASDAALQQILQSGPVQVLVHNAGIHDDAPLAGMAPEQWRRVIDVSLNGFYNVSKPLLLPMMSTRWGRVIAMSSVAGVVGNRGQANYAAAKAGLHGAIKSLSKELASRGITANAIAPGIITSAMSAGHFDDRLIKQLVPAQRAGSPEEVAALVNFLCSEEAGYITGQVISINGGIA